MAKQQVVPDTQVDSDNTSNHADDWQVRFGRALADWYHRQKQDEDRRSAARG